MTRTTPLTMEELEAIEPAHFIEEQVIADLKPGGRFEGRQVHTRFPPEPNGLLHIGHAKAIYIDFSVAERFQGICHLRMDDTNPTKEETAYVHAIQEDIHWLGYDWKDRFFYASDFFPQMYALACQLIRKGLAYVCALSAEEIRQTRGDLSTPATPSPWRDRPIDESLRLFEEMKAGVHPDGSLTLRAKIDLESGNFNMRDPVLYRIVHATHHRTGDDWCIYPMYDYAHPLEDALEGITHSLCSLEFEDHRPLYDWVIDNLDGLPSRPRQIEFARLNITHTVMSKRRLRLLVEEGLVQGWDDPRMPTLSGLRRRGYTPQAIRSFCERIGVSKVNSTVDASFLEHCLREDLNMHADRLMGVLDPVKLVLVNYPEDQTESFDIENNPNQPESGSRTVSFSRECWIDRDDFRLDPPRKFFRLSPDKEVRLKSAYIIRCTDVVHDENGRLVEIHATYDPQSRGGQAPDGRKVRGTIHWVDARTALDAQVHLYEALFEDPEPDAQDRSFLELVNRDSLTVLEGCKVEAAIAQRPYPSSFQFLRLGYFCLDPDSKADQLVINRSVSLKDSYRGG